MKWMVFMQMKEMKMLVLRKLGEVKRMVFMMMEEMEEIKVLIFRKLEEVKRMVFMKMVEIEEMKMLLFRKLEEVQLRLSRGAGAGTGSRLAGLTGNKRKKCIFSH